VPSRMTRHALLSDGVICMDGMGAGHPDNHAVSVATIRYRSAKYAGIPVVERECG
jgi:hypothetical protein